MSQVKLDDIAKILHVSKVTVSKALRDYPDISTEMKKRVRKVAADLNYRPNYIARNLSSKQTHTIGVVVPDVSNIFFSYAVHSIVDYASEQNYQTILTVSRENEEIERKNIDSLLSMRVDGLIVSVSQDTKDKHIFEMVKKTETPLVFFDREIKNMEFSSVVYDNFKGSFDAIEFIIQQGYTKIAHLGGYLNTNIGKERWEGCRAALDTHHVPVNDEWIIHKGFNKSDGYEGFMELYNNGNLPEVIFTVNGHVAGGAYKAIKKVGLKIPQDIGIMGYGFNEYTNSFYPPLTIMSEKPELLGKRAMELLLEEINETRISGPQKIVLPLDLEIHDSIIIRN